MNDDDDNSDASSFHDEELVDLGSSSEDEFLAVPTVVVRSGALGEGESSAESLGRPLDGGGKAPQPPVRDWLGVPGLPPVSTATAPAVSSALARPPRTSSFPSPTPGAPASPARPQRAGSQGPGPLVAAEGSHSRTPSASEKLRRELPALHTAFGGAPAEQAQHQPDGQRQQPASAKEREHQLYQQLTAQQQHGGPRSALASPPPYAHSPTSALPSKAALAAADEADDGVHAHRDGYTNSPSLFRLPDLGSSTNGGRLLSPLGAGSAGLGGPTRSLASAPSDGKLFDPASFTLGSHSESAPRGLVSLLACSSSSSSHGGPGKRVLKAILDELAIKDVVNLFSALGPQDRLRLEASKEAVEELRVWSLGWAGYMRGALEGSSVAHSREGWDRVGWAVILDFCTSPSCLLLVYRSRPLALTRFYAYPVSAMLEPPTTAFPPGQVLSISLTTLLLRASHAIRPPAGPHLIPFEEEDVLPPPLQPTLAALNPKTRMRGLPAGRLLVLPSPLAAQPQQHQQQQHPASAAAFGLSGSQSAIDGRNGPFPPPAKGSIRSRRSSISEAVGLHWGGGGSRTRASAAGLGGVGGGGPPSSFGQQQAPALKLAPSSASIYSVDNHSKAKLAPPPPRLPEPRRYEFPQPVGVGSGGAGRQHRRQASDSQSMMSSAGTLSFGGHAQSSIGHHHPQSIHRPRGVSAGPSATSASSSSQMLAPSLASGVSSPDLSNGHRSWMAELNAAPPVPAFAQPLRKSSSKDGSWTSLGAGSSSARGGGGSHSASASLLGGGRWDTASSSESSSGRMTRRRSDEAPLAEPLFLSLTSPYRFGRAPIIKIVVPFPADVLWPSGPALKLCHRHLDANGLLSKLRLGDLVENLAVSWRHRKKEGAAGAGWTTGTMVFIPPYLHPLSTTHASLAQAGASPATAVPSPSSAKTAVADGSQAIKAAHLPASLNMFLLPPTYYHSVIPPPYIIYLDLTPFAGRVTETLRLANQRAEVLSAGGDVLSLDQWVHEAGFFIEESGAGGPWEGTMVTLEADGTKEVRLTGRLPTVQNPLGLTFRLRVSPHRAKTRSSVVSTAHRPSAGRGRLSPPRARAAASGSSQSSVEPFLAAEPLADALLWRPLHLRLVRETLPPAA
jgi:hypothetical protein